MGFPFSGIKLNFLLFFEIFTVDVEKFSFEKDEAFWFVFLSVIFIFFFGGSWGFCGFFEIVLGIFFAIRIFWFEVDFFCCGLFSFNIDLSFDRLLFFVFDLIFGFTFGLILVLAILFFVLGLAFDFTNGF